MIGRFWYNVFPVGQLCKNHCNIFITVYSYMYLSVPRHIYRVSQKECARLRENVPYVKVHRCNPKHL